MARDLAIEVEDRPGKLASLGEALGKAGVNIDGLCGIGDSAQGIIHILVQDAAAARKAVEAAGFKVKSDNEVLVLDVADRPGAVGALARKIANAGVNVKLVYLATRTRLVVGADNLEKARGAVG